MKDVAWAYAEMVDDQMHCKFCKRKIKGGGGGIHRLKLHLAGLRGKITTCEAPIEEIGEIRKELRDQFQKFEEDKARQKEIEVEIGRTRTIKHMMAANPILIMRTLHLSLAPMHQTPFTMFLPLWSLFKKRVRV